MFKRRVSKITMRKFLSCNCDVRVWKENRGIAERSSSAWNSLGTRKRLQSNCRRSYELPRSKESKKLCSKKDASLLRSATKDSILNFSCATVGKELADKAPFFHRLLLALADPKSLSQSQDTERYPGVCAAAAILLKNQDKGMSLVPYVISMILKAGRTSKKVSAVTFVFCHRLI